MFRLEADPCYVDASEMMSSGPPNLFCADGPHRVVTDVVEHGLLSVYRYSVRMRSSNSPMTRPFERTVAMVAVEVVRMGQRWDQNLS